MGLLLLAASEDGATRNFKKWSFFLFLVDDDEPTPFSLQSIISAPLCF